MRQGGEKAAQFLFFLCACISVFSVVLICLFLLINGVPAIKNIGIENFLGGMQWKPLENLFGILPMMLGSIFVTGGAILVGVPLGILCAVYMTNFCPKPLYRMLKPAINLLAGVPSIVYGFWGLMVIVPIVRQLFGGSGKGILTASLLLGFMVLPTIIGVTETSLCAVPRTYYEGALALGATHEKSVFFALLPAAKSGILAGVILGVGRVLGETMAVIMVAGNQAAMPQGITSGVRTMTANIAMEMAYASGLHKDALIATAAVLFLFILIINLCFTLLYEKTI